MSPAKRLPEETLDEYGAWGPPSSGLPIHPAMRHAVTISDGRTVQVTGAWLNPRRVLIAIESLKDTRTRYVIATLMEPGQPGAYGINLTEHTLGFVRPPSDIDALYFDASEEPEIAHFADKAIRRMWPNGPRLVTP